jgi:hypothetical protein
MLARIMGCCCSTKPAVEADAGPLSATALESSLEKKTGDKFEMFHHTFDCAPLGFTVKDASGYTGVSVGAINNTALPLKVDDIVVAVRNQNVSKSTCKDVVAKIKGCGFPLKITFKRLQSTEHEEEIQRKVHTQYEGEILRCAKDNNVVRFKRSAFDPNGRQHGRMEGQYAGNHFHLGINHEGFVMLLSIILWASYERDEKKFWDKAKNSCWNTGPFNGYDLCQHIRYATLHSTQTLLSYTPLMH